MWRYFDYGFASIFSFVFQFVEERTPRCVVNLFRKYASGHTQNGKFFDCNQIELFDEMCGNFMLKIISLILDFLMKLFELQNRFTSLIRAFFASGNSALNNSQFLLSRFVIFEIINLRSVRECQKTTYACVKSNGFACFRQWLDRSFNRENRKPLSAFLFNRERFHFTDYITRQFDFQFSDFRKLEFVSRKIESALSVAKTIESVLSLETRKTCFLLSFNATEKALKRLVKSFQNVLQNLAVNVFVFGIGLLYRRKLFVLVKAIDVDSIDCPSITSFLKSGIIELTTKIESIFKFSGLRFTWRNSELVGYNCRSHNQILNQFGCDRSTEKFAPSPCFDFNYTTNSFHNSILFSNSRFKNIGLKAPMLSERIHPPPNPKRLGRGVLLISGKSSFKTITAGELARVAHRIRFTSKRETVG